VVVALRVLESKCWIVTKSVGNGDGKASYMFCQSRVRGISCPLEGLPGKKAFELSGECFEIVKRGQSGGKPLDKSDAKG